MKRIGILITPQINLFALSCATEVFAGGRAESPTWYECEFICFEKPPFSTRCGIAIDVNCSRSLANIDTLIIPSWPVEQKHVRLPMAEQIMALYARGGQIHGFGSGAFLLAQLGLLENKSATTHWRHAAQFRKRFTHTHYLDDVMYCIDGNIGTSAGSAAALDLGIEIVRRDFGHDVANRVAKRLLFSPQRQGGQGQFVDPNEPLYDGNLADVMKWAVKHLDKIKDVDALAERAGMSRRSFDRHFRAATGSSAKVWLNKQRITIAKSILEDSDVALDILARLVGFDNAITLRFNFNKYVGISPAAYRSEFGKKEERHEKSVV
ncbi:GlxA family transcriptional regulator [Aestuariibacter salexigens]|uniref:GlxA family transcriptional regulator n=1 Tax=Aestuariibacter salexigens TaxID=226010 RepID=UPI000423B68B|nr:helix-turn-helix domain-containing protein [Aestuariibacter salexigens]